MKKFLDLVWYDAAIEFLFKLVAKTSEPLLATGLTVSAADYLSKGAVMTGNSIFSLSWAWTQAVALESSSGVVFVYALQAFRQADKIKGAIYLALALMLAIVGGGMLLLQINSVSFGSNEVAILPLNVMRVVVSIAYIFLLRAKSIRFTDLSDTNEQRQPQPMLNQAPSHVMMQRQVQEELPVDRQLEGPEEPHPQPVLLPRQSNRSNAVDAGKIMDTLIENPDKSIRKVASMEQVSHGTIFNLRRRLNNYSQQEVNKTEQ